MPTPCPECRLRKKKVYFDIDKARSEAKKLAVQNEKTYALYKEGKNSVAYSEAATARSNGYDIIELISKYA
jgi:hypothetical protein